MFDGSIYLSGLAVILCIAVATWLTSLWKRDVSIVDSVWSILLLAAALTYIWRAPLVTQRGELMLVLATAWAVRLTVYITSRNWGEPEDRRYRNIRARHEPHFAFKSLVIVFVLQGLLAWIVSLPLLPAATGMTELGTLDYLGAAIVVAAILFEALADWQLSQFRADPANRGQVMEAGLWRYTRHPNYFGECCVWWGFWLMAVSAGGWWSVPGPVLMTTLLLRVSGVSLLERDIGERRPAYRRYIERTNAFIPGPRRA